jgi:tRNA dimethylallyltransferase
MLQLGFLEEARKLFDSGRLEASMPSMRCVGYRQAWEHFEGLTDAVEMRLKAIYATRQLAKRQITWLRREQHALWYDPALGSAQDSMFTEVKKFLEK